MKTLIPLLLLLPFICFGQVPQSMNYQAMALDDNGFEIAQTQISIQVSIIEESPSGLTSFVEDHTVTTDAFGMFSINIGQGNSDDDYSSVDWSKSNFLRVELDEEMDGVYTLMGVSPFNSVPYSYMAENVMNPEDLMDNLGDHNATQTLDMDSNYVSQVLAPELPLDAANKQYVDEMIGDITTGAGEIVYFNYSNASSNLENYSNGSYYRFLLAVVPSNKIYIAFHDYNVSTSSPGSFLHQEYNLKHNNTSYFPAELESGSGSSPTNLIYVFQPGDSIYSANISSNYNMEVLYGIFYAYTVTETQIDDNTTSYSMVSLDEGASSSGGSITEGSGGSSSQGGYMISEIHDEMNLVNAANYCSNLNYNNYNDWYIPTMEDLNNIFIYKSLINPADTIFLNEFFLGDYRVLSSSFLPTPYGAARLLLESNLRIESSDQVGLSGNVICIRKN